MSSQDINYKIVRVRVMSRVKIQTNDTVKLMLLSLFYRAKDWQVA